MTALTQLTVAGGFTTKSTPLMTAVVPKGIASKVTDTAIVESDDN